MYIRTIIYVAWVVVVAAGSATAAGGQHQVHRSSDPSSAHGGPPLGSVSVSPYDDPVLEDGVDYYYVVRDKQNQPTTISVHKNAPHGAVRIAFDDRNGLAAPVDPSQSSVTVSPSLIPADGASLSLVTIIPRDADGVPLGAGLQIDFDIEILHPGFLDGPLIDQGDGSYFVGVVSQLSGAGQVWINVEGIPLHDEPTITFEYAGGPTDLRELAKQDLGDLTAYDGAFDAALDGVDPGDPGAEKVQAAWDEALDGFDELARDDYDLDPGVVDNYLKSAVGELVSALDDPGEVGPQAILDLIDDLLDIGRRIARFHLDRAVGLCGPCDPAEGGEICDAEEALDAGDAERASADPDSEEVANQYGTAAGKARDAYEDCPG